MSGALNGRANRQAGFTLVELLLAVTLLSILLALAYGGLTASIKAPSRGQDVLEETGRLRLTHQFVRRQLNQMLPLEWPDESEEVLMRFTGGENFVQFVAPMPGYLGSGGPHVQRLEVVTGDEGLDLVFMHANWQGFTQDRLYDRDPVVLLRDVEFAGFEFMNRNDEGLAGDWIAYWEDTDILPVAVRVDLDFGEDSEVTWPQLATGVRIDESSVRQSANDRTYDQVIRDMIEKRQGGR